MGSHNLRKMEQQFEFNNCFSYKFVLLAFSGAFFFDKNKNQLLFAKKTIRNGFMKQKISFPILRLKVN